MSAPSITCALCGGLNFRTDRAVCHSCEPSPPPPASGAAAATTDAAAALAEASATHGAALYRRLLEQQRRQQHEARRRSSAAGSNSSREGVTVAAADQKPDVGDAADAPRGSDTQPAAAGGRGSKRPRTGRDVIDLISSSDEEGGDGRRSRKASGDEAAAARIQADDADADAPPFLSRSFAVVAFDASDFAPLDGAAALLRARKNPAAGDLGGGVPPAAPSSPPKSQKTEPVPPPVAAAAAAPRLVPEPPTRSQQPLPPPPASAAPVATRTLQRENPGPAPRVVIPQEDAGELFQTRVFDAIEFDPRDFATVHDGLNVARRSRPSAPSDGHVDATQDEAAESPAPSSSSSLASAPVVAPPQPIPAPRRFEARAVGLLPPSVPARQGAAAVPSMQFQEAGWFVPEVMRARRTAPATATGTMREQGAPQSSTPTTAPSAAAADASGATVLAARKKSPHDPQASSAVGSEVVGTPETKSVAKAESVSLRFPVTIDPISKPPLLGSCSAEFLSFMKNLVDGDDDEDETRKLHRQLLEVVDLTNLTDSSDDEDDDSDGYVISEPPMPASAASVGVGVHQHGFVPGLHYAAPLPGASAAGFFAGPPLLPQPGMGAAGVSGPKLDNRRAARQLEPCVICEEKRWVKTMIHCSDCNKYYHKRCAKEYGDDSICWNCELDGMIDDSELTETSRDEVIGMLSTLRPDSSEDEDDGDEGGEERDGAVGEEANANGEPQTDEAAPRSGTSTSDESKTDEAGSTRPAQLPGATTKAMQRWKAFLDVSTATIDKSFNDVTNSITSELQSAELKAKYSKGFTTPEIFHAAISEVLDSYANLQDQLDREAREKPKVPSAAAAPEAAAESAPSSSGAAFPAPPPALLDLSRSYEAAVGASAAPDANS